MTEGQAERYVERLVWLVRAEENLWNKSHCLYGNTEMEEASWNSVTSELNLLQNTNKITVENAGSTWKALIKSYRECQQYETATIFKLYQKLRFIDENICRRSDYDDLFSRNKGKYLVLVQIILNVLFLVAGVYVTSAFTTIEKTTSVSQLMSTCVLWLSTMPMSDNSGSRLMVTEAKQSYFSLYVFLTSVSVSMAICLFSCFSEYNCMTDAVHGDYVMLIYIVFVTMISQLAVILHHRLRLDRPPTMNEMSTVLITELILGLTFTVPLLMNQLPTFYLVISVWIFTNFIIIIYYYYICWKYAKILYRFQKRSQLVAVFSPANPYQVRFEREE